MEVASAKQNKPGFEESSELSKTFNIRMTLTSIKVNAVEQGILIPLLAYFTILLFIFIL